MRSGLRKHRVFVDEPGAGQADTGEETTTWTTRGALWCAIEPIGGREAVRAGGLLAGMDTRITSNWSPLAARITAKWRMRFIRAGVTTIYNIARPPAEVNMARREIEFVCNSGQNAG